MNRRNINNWIGRIGSLCWWSAVAIMLYLVWGKVGWGVYAIIVVVTLQSMVWHYDNWQERRRNDRQSVLRRRLENK